MTINTREIPIATRLAPIGDISKEMRTVDVTWSTGARVKRYDFWKDRSYFEELSTDPGHVRMGRLSAGAPVLDSHKRYSVRDVIGVVENPKLSPRPMATLRFSDRQEVDSIVQDIRSKILQNVSVGYATYRVEELPADDRSEGLPIYRATDWEPMEISLVPVGADPGAGMRDQDRKFSCEFVYLEERNMPNEAMTVPVSEQRAAVMQNAGTGPSSVRPLDIAAIEKSAAEKERKRAVDIRLAVRAARMDESFAERMIVDDTPADRAREMIIDAMAAESEKTSVSSHHMSPGRDEKDVRRQGMQDAMLHRMIPSHKISDEARDYAYMPLVRMAEEMLRSEHVNVKSLAPREIAERALMTTSDFPSLMAGVINKRLRAAYDESQGSFRLWARRAPNAPDFRAMQVTQLSSMPDLVLVPEHGEFTYGALTDGKETYSVLTYGRIVGVTRQVLINDDLRSLDRMASGFGAAASRLENRLVYGILTSNPLMGDGLPLFHANHGNLAAAGAAISDVTLGAGRTAMRLQKGQQNEELNLMPNFLIVPAAKEQIAYNWTSAGFVPVSAVTQNEFRAGGRTALEVIVDPVLDAASSVAWYLVANNSQIDTIEYAFLDGSEGVYTESRLGFTIDGMEVKARLDFGAKAIDHRGVWKNPGV